MSRLRLVVLTALAMLAFAGNSLLCRLALKQTTLDPASFTAVRLLSGAVMLCLVVQLPSWLSPRQRRADSPSWADAGNWRSALALFAYAAGFSFAYVSLTAATGALLLFSAVQATMIGHGLWAGERLQQRQWLGLLLALTGLLGLLLPGLSAPPLIGSVLMLGAGVAWGIYSLRGKGAGDATQKTAGNFLRAVPLAVALCSVSFLRGDLALDVWQSAGNGLGYAVLSGAVASGLGYALWYAVLPSLPATQAATLQLSVPVIAALGGVLFIGEAMTLRLLLASSAILGGIALVILAKKA